MGKYTFWMGRNNTGGVVDGQEIRTENTYCQLCLENGCHICVCSLFYVIITHLNLFVCVCEFTCMCLPVHLWLANVLSYVKLCMAHVWQYDMGTLSSFWIAALQIYILRIPQVFTETHLPYRPFLSSTYPDLYKGNQSCRTYVHI